MMNATVLLLAENQQDRARLTQQLSETKVFERIVMLDNPAELFVHLQDQSADLVCWSMGSQSQTSWTTRLQSMEQWHDLPLIAFAEASDPGSLIQGFRLGASDCVSYDIRTEELSVRLQGQLKRWKRLLELRQSKQQLQKLALTDPLTGLGNRATFDMSIKQAAARTQRSGSPYSLLLIDLDHFKGFNDSYGHQAGDEVLKQVAEVIGGCARDADISCRYGGEEFAVILPDTEAKNALILAERIHKRIAKVSRKLRQFRQPITVSIGISSASRIGSGHPTGVIEEADKALYRAKANGRNCSEIFHQVKQRRVEYAYTPAHELAFGTFGA